MTTYRLKILRSRRGSPEPPRFEEYTVDIDDRLSVLDALEQLRLDQEGGLMYRHSCHHASCGTCACKIDGEERLACVTRLSDLDSDRVTLEPLDGFDCEGDLVADMAPLYRDLSEDWSITRPTERSEQAERLEDCIECGACVSACPAAGVGHEFMGPAAMAALHREVEKRPENSAKLLALAAGDRGYALCEKAFDCSRRCPSKVAPGRRIGLLRKLAG